MLALASPPELVIVAALVIAAVLLIAVAAHTGPPPPEAIAREEARAAQREDVVAAIFDQPAPPYDWATAGEWNPFPWPLDAVVPSTDHFVTWPEGSTVRDLIALGYRPDAHDGPFGMTLVRIHQDAPELAR